MSDPAVPQVPQVPKPENRSGLPQLSYRIGDYATVRQRLLSQIAHLTLNGSGPPNNRPLARLTSRSADDPAIALLDAWAIVADVLTFYQERIINEGYLLTATERQSVLELARTIGYELAPGVAASTFLAFTVEDAAGSAGVATVPKGTQVLSLPLRQDELPQTFETSADLLARADWNALLPRPSRPQQIAPATRQLFLAGITTQLQVGDALLLRDEADPAQLYLLDLVTVQSLNDRNSTQVEWRDWLPAIPPKPLRQPQIFAFRQKAQLFDQSIRGGVFRLSSGSSAWTTQNLGLPNAEVTCLASLDNILFLGSNNGVFRLSAEGVWEAVNNGLTLLNVQSLSVGAGGLLFAGTLNGGLFRSSDQGETWVQINLGGVELRDVGGGKQQPFSTGLPNSVVRAVIVPFTTTVGTGTIQSDQSGKVVGIGTQFTQAFASSRQIVVGNQRRTVTVKNDTELQLDRPFQKFSMSYRAITSIGEGNTAISLEETEGTISNLGTKVTGVNTHFLRLQVSTTDKILIALGQTRKITQIISDEELIVDSPFNRFVVPFSSEFKIATPSTKTYLAGTDDGIYLTEDRGRNWRSTNLDDRVVFALLDNGSELWAGTSAGVYRATAPSANWEQSKLPDRSVRCLLQFDSRLLTGTDAGIFYSDDSGQTWNSGDIPEESLVFALTQVDSAVYAATSRGVYSSSNGQNWTAIPTGLTTPQIVAIAAQGQDLLAGGRSTNVSAADWQNFLLPAQEIDLDGQYSKILPESWAVLRNGSEIAVMQVQRSQTVARAQANQEAKVTRITPTLAVPQPQRFDRRRTIVLAQSELLPLAEESLTVTDQQNRIFADPLAADTVFLQQYVQGLQPQQRLILSGKAIQVQLNQIGGLYRSNPDPIAWTRINRNLDNLQVQALTRQFGVLYAGTRQGVFRSVNAGETWEPFNLGHRPVQAFSPATSSLLLAGTPDGLFGWTGETQGWRLLTEGLIYQDVQAIAVLSPTALSPTASPEPETAIESEFAALRVPTVLIGTLGGGLFRSRDGGQTWTTTGPTNLDILALATDPQEQILLAGTRGSGLFYSNDRGESWRQITATRPGQGTVASTGIVLTRSGNSDDRQTDRQSDLQPGDRITVGDQSRTILSLEPAITLDAPFRPDLPPGTSFTIATGLTSSTITALAIAPAPDHPIFYAGTAGSGVFRSRDGGDRWTAVNANLTDLEIRCLAVEVSGRVLAGTASGGVFRSANQGELWAPINAGLRNLDVRAILADAEALVVGGSGILVSEATRTATELQTGDRLQVIAPPLSIPPQGDPAIGPALGPADPFAYQRWLLKDRDGFTGSLETIAPLTAAELTLLPANSNSETISELVTVKTPPDDQQHPVLELAAPLRYAYDPATVTIAANVVEATHGETVVEPLGSGDGMATNQQFVLKQPPLTYLAADTPSGIVSTLELRVNGILWQEVPSLYGQNGQAEAYIIRREDDGTTTVSFGDGSSGARLPTGQENVTAVYRNGIGLAGNLGANRLSLLKTQPLGIRGVNNPLPATGAADREQLQETQVKAPRTVRTLDRIVSLRDFEDFTRTFAGIGKAQAAALWTGNAQIVHLTIAAAGGEIVLPESRLYQKLLAAIDAARDPVQRVQVDSYQPLKFNLEARLLLDPSYEAKTVIAQGEAALRQAFAFEQRAFGQPVTSAEVIAQLQAVAGIIAVDLDALYRLGSSRTRSPALAANLARWNSTTGQFDPAELLLLNPEGIGLTVTPTL